MERDTCYACQKQGHWAKDCPDKLTNKPISPSTRTTFTNDQDIPDKQCPCGGGTCLIRTSRTKENPGRKFYRCPVNLGKNCNFFQFCDKESPYKRQNISVSQKPQLMNSVQRPDIAQSAYPECACGAGICNIYIDNTERNRSRKYFGCPVKKGQGACNFIKWLDSLGNAINVDESDYGGSSGSTYMGSEKSSSKERVKEEMVQSYYGVDDPVVASFGDLRLTEEKTTVVAKPGACYRCGEEGHWSKDCLKPPQSSPCYKCGKSGHWMKDCPK